MLDIYDSNTWAAWLDAENQNRLQVYLDNWFADPENAPSTVEVTLLTTETITIDFNDQTTWPGYVAPVPEGPSTPAEPLYAQVRVVEHKEIKDDVKDLKERI